MSVMRSLFLTSVILGATSGAALAETRPTRTPTAPPSQQLPNTYNRDRLTWDRVVTDRSRLTPSKAQWARAEQAAQLINSGRCVEARTQAASQGDQPLAARIAEVCASRL